MSFSVTFTFPSCTSFGCTNWMDSSMPSSFSRMAHTSPSKSLRVKSLYFLGLLLIMASETNWTSVLSADLTKNYRAATFPTPSWRQHLWGLREDRLGAQVLFEPRY